MVRNIANVFKKPFWKWDILKENYEKSAKNPGCQMCL